MNIPKHYINEKIRVGCDIFFLANNDWCNTCAKYMKSIETQGLKTIGLKGVKHVFKYPNEMYLSKSLSIKEGG